MKYFVDSVDADFIFLNESLIFQFEETQATDIFHGEYCHALNSDDMYDPELPIIKNRSNGGTMIFWRKSLDQFVKILPTETTSFLGIVFQPPDTQPSLHVSIYLPTSGKESEFIAEITKLRIFIEDTLEAYPGCPLFIRGDSNVNKNNIARLNIFKDFKSIFKLSCIPLGHNTYHHFQGGGVFDLRH